MGKNWRQPQLQPMISLENGNPGCMKGIFHHFNHRKWYNVKKRIPHRRSSGSKNPDDVERLKTTNAGEAQHESANFSSHGRSSESGSVHKGSMKSRLKALFSEEVCRRKGRHNRSSSYPTRMPLDRVPSMHRVDVSGRAPSAETGTLNGSLDQLNGSHSLLSSLLDPALPRICGEPNTNGATCSLCAARLTKNYLRESDTKIASHQDSKIFFDALDLLNIRKELFLKVMQDPTTSLSHQVQNQRESTSKLGLTKSVSFPTPGSSGSGVPSPDINYPHVCTKDSNGTAIRYSANMLENMLRETGIHVDGEPSNEPLMIQDSLDSAAAFGSPKEYKKQHQHVNKLIMKRFKNLREKIKHAMKETRKERQRIVMDGVLHKIPFGYPKKANEEGNLKNDAVAQNWGKYSPGDGIKNDQFSLEGNSQLAQPDAIRRTASFNEPLSRYNRLYELTYNTEASNQLSDGMISRPTVSRKKGSMSRILSLPDMRSQSFSRLDRWPATNSPEMSMKLVASKDEVPFDDCSGDPGIHVLGEPSDLGMDDPDKGIVPPMEEDATTGGGGISFSVEDSELTPDVEPGEEDLIPSHIQSYNNLLIQVGLKNRADFEYVKDVFELSGFTGIDIIGKWHAEGQPVDPMVFNEVEGCQLAQPDSSGNEEGGGCNNQILFDLINEVLLEIYGKTFSYWPKLLTNCSQVHPMPVGYHLFADVWTNINWYLQRIPKIDPSLDDAVNHDLSKSDGWMNVQFEAECVGIELEDMVFDDILDELVFPFNIYA